MTVSFVPKRTARQGYAPHRLPVLHEEAELAPSENEAPPPLTFDENVDIFFLTWLLWQDGQVTSSTLLRLSTSSSKDCPHSLQENS